MCSLTMENRLGAIHLCRPLGGGEVRLRLTHADGGGVGQNPDFLVDVING